MKDQIFGTMVAITITSLLIYFFKSWQSKKLEQEREVLDILCGVINQAWNAEEDPSYNEILLKAINNLSSNQIQELSAHLKEHYAVEICSLEDASEILIDVRKIINDPDSQKELFIIIEAILAEIPTNKLVEMYEKYLNSYLLENNDTLIDEAIIDNMPTVFKLITNTIGHNDRLVLRNELVITIDTLATSNINDTGLIILKNEKIKILDLLSC